jgi:phosphatidylglycerol:prolipoprotein diacylglycerol transferase
MTLPYIPSRDISIGPATLHPFGILVAIGIVVGSIVARRRARVLGLDEARFESLVFFTVAGGIVLSHVFDTLAYHPEVVLRQPWELIMVHHGLSSFGGFFGAALVFSIHCHRRGLDPLRHADAIGYGLPVGWLFGRLGCTVVHDHPGRHSHSWLAVAPGPAWPDGPRFDLGLLEFLYTPVLIAVVLVVGHYSRRRGLVIASLAAAYAPVRFALDFFRAGPDEGGDVRYGGLTPGQWSSIAMLVIAVALFVASMATRDPALASASSAAPGPADGPQPEPESQQPEPGPNASEQTPT